MEKFPVTMLTNIHDVELFFISVYVKYVAPRKGPILVPGQDYFGPRGKI